MNKTAKAHFALIVANLIYSANFIIAKEVMPNYIKPFGLVLIRVAGGTIFYWIIHAFFIKEKIDKKYLPHLLLLAIFGVATNQMSFLKGLNLTTPINAAIMMITTPILVLIISAVILKEKISALNITGVLLGFIGATSLLLIKSDFSFGSTTFYGDLFVFINALSWGIYLVLVKPFMKIYNTITILKWVFLFGFFMVLPFGYSDVISINIVSFTPQIWLCVCFVVIATTVAAYLLNTYALKELSSSVVSAYIYLQPLLTTSIALLTDKDKINSIKIISAMFIFTGVYWASKKRSYEK